MGFIPLLRDNLFLKKSVTGMRLSNEPAHPRNIQIIFERAIGARLSIRPLIRSRITLRGRPVAI
jgi:hypothetical protein